MDRHRTLLTTANHIGRHLFKTDVIHGIVINNTQYYISYITGKIYNYNTDIVTGTISNTNANKLRHDYIKARLNTIDRYSKGGRNG